MRRKRQRSRAALTDDDEQPTDSVDVVDTSESPQDQVNGSQVRVDGEEPPDESEERKKELEVWDAFKEEHHEVLEQLPLSLHRQFKLMRELDSQGEIFHVDLLASVRRYVQLREGLAARHAQVAEGVRPSVPDVNHVEQADAMQIDTTHGAATVNDRTDSRAQFQPKTGETTCTLLQHIAQTSEEAIRTAEEKVSIAQTAYETVDRHIRLLDQAIKEQEAAISLGARPGTHLAPILLPDLVVPRWARPPRVEHSPVPSLSPEPGLYVEEPPTLELSPPQVPSPKAPKKGKKVAAPKVPKPDKEEILSPAVAAVDEAAMPPRTRRTSVRLTLPAQPLVTGLTIPADPDEQRFCYCGQVSYGTMIACESEHCKLEWFHFECTGLLQMPRKKTKWYCRECKPKTTQKGRSRA